MASIDPVTTIFLITAPEGVIPDYFCNNRFRVPYEDERREENEETG
jgi:hypothetical protein